MKIPAGAGSLRFTGTPRTFKRLADFDRLLQAAVAGGKVDAFWRKVVAIGQMPLLFGDNTAVFLYRGPANKVVARGDFRAPYVRQGETDLWMLVREFEPDARVEYEIVLNSRKCILDPLNPLTETGGVGTHSVVRMPQYVAPAHAHRREGVAHGKFGENITVSSSCLGYDVNIRVYTPAGYRRLRKLPVIYVADGQDYTNPGMGEMVNALDNLIAARRIRPVMAVFVDPRDPVSGENRREHEFLHDCLAECPLCDFIATELVPMVDAKYRSDPSPDARVMLGFSYGGMFTSHMGLAYPDVFHGVAIQSPYITRKWILDMYRREERLPLKVFLSHGTYDPGASSRRLRDILRLKKYPLRYVERHEGHSFGLVRGVLEDLLIYFFAL